MADLALADDLDSASDEPQMTPPGGAAAGGVPSLDQRCHVFPDRPLPALSTGNARAFVAVDPNELSLPLYALILDPRIPFRVNAIRHARDLGEVSTVKPKMWGSIDWPQTGRRETYLLLHRPPGGPLMPTIDADFPPWTVAEINRCLMTPMAELLSALSDQRMSHRNIRPTNLFRKEKGEPVVAGEIFSAPPGFNQPSAFEPVERAMCPPTGRGFGDITDDLYALGVTALFLALGRNPVADLDDAALLSKRTEFGSYAALTAAKKPPAELAPAIRSLMHDNPHERWTIGDLLRWTDVGVANQAKPMTIPRSDRGFEFEEGVYHSRRQLALAFSQNWTAALEVVKGDAVERWAERSLKDRELAQQIIDCRHSTPGGPRRISDDLLLARTIITLDTAGPLRFRGLAVMPDGLGALAASLAADTEMSATFSEMISMQVMQFWLGKQHRTGSMITTGRGDAQKIAAFLEKAGPGFGIERCIYEMNNGLACQSPRFGNANAVDIRTMMEALDIGAKRGEQQIDRHVAAFLAARYSGSIDNELEEFGAARGGEEALLAQLKIFAAVQFKHGPRELPGLAEAFLPHLDILLASYRNIALRQRLRRSAERTAATGKLPELLGVIFNKKLLKADKKGFDTAKRHYQAIERQVHFHENSRLTLPARSLVVGRRAAAYLSGVIGATAVMIIMASGLA